MKKILALLTGRGNNTLKDKNILPIKGKPLLYYPANAALKSELIDHYFVSSDDPNILNEANKLGYTKILRPLELAKPDSQHVDAILHALDVLEKKESIVPDIVVVLLANNGIVKTSWINSAIQYILDDNTISSVVPVFQDQDHHPLRAKKIDSNGMLQPFIQTDEGRVSSNRQDLEPSFFLGHNFWVLNVGQSIKSKATGQPPWTFMGNKIKPFIVDDCFDVHVKEDLIETEKWIEINYEF